MPKHKKHELWLLKAESDLYVARTIAKGEGYGLDTAISHTQQCGEKALKAFLVYHKQVVPKTHDLVKLQALCIALDSDFSSINYQVACLNPLSTEFRYPEEELYIPSMELMNMSIERASGILQLVRRKIIQ